MSEVGIKTGGAVVNSVHAKGGIQAASQDQIRAEYCAQATTEGDAKRGAAMAGAAEPKPGGIEISAAASGGVQYCGFLLS